MFDPSGCGLALFGHVITQSHNNTFIKFALNINLFTFYIDGKLFLHYSPSLVVRAFGVMRRSIRILAAIGLCGALCAARAAVLTTITVDGDMSDWGAVLADPFQTAYDGPALGLPDLDAPIQSTGRDLMTFAWTYDGSHLFFYARRAASASNQQLFWFYCDTNDDGLLQTGEPVISVDWKGSNRSATVYGHAYSSAGPGGDPLGDPSGYADGWTMPGTVSGGLQLESHPGRRVERRRDGGARLLGQPGGPGRLGGPFSRLLLEQLEPSEPDRRQHGRSRGASSARRRRPGVDLSSGQPLRHRRSRRPAPLRPRCRQHRKPPDTINLSWTSSGSFLPSSVRFYHDVDGDGRPGAADPPAGGHERRRPSGHRSSGCRGRACPCSSSWRPRSA